MKSLIGRMMSKWTVPQRKCAVCWLVWNGSFNVESCIIECHPSDRAVSVPSVHFSLEIWDADTHNVLHFSSGLGNSNITITLLTDVFVNVCMCFEKWGLFGFELVGLCVTVSSSWLFDKPAKLQWNLWVYICGCLACDVYVSLCDDDVLVFLTLFIRRTMFIIILITSKGQALQ